MSSRDDDKEAFHRKLGQLRSITNSTAVDKTSVIVDASRYIEELKDKVEKLNQEVGTSQNPHNPLPMVTVETLEKGFVINVLMEMNCPGLLVSILETSEELGLEVVDARVSCEDNFQLQAIVQNQGNVDQGVNVQMVKQEVIETIRKWSENSQQD